MPTYRIAEGSTQDLPDVQALVATLSGLGTERQQGDANLSQPPLRDLFTAGGDVVVSRAPGRLDVMGGIADYSGSLVLEMPIREAALAALQLRSDRLLKIVSLGADDDRDALFELSLDALENEGEPIEYAAARALFASNIRSQWAAYVAGAFLVLMRECGGRFDRGASLLIASDVPEGKGVSSSAAIEVATMRAAASAYGIALDPVRLAVLCQKVENLVVGAPCGLMDQMTSACGEANRLLALLCQPAELRGTVAVPRDVEFWGIDSGVRHSVAGADYGSVRVGAFMGYRMIAEAAGLSWTRSDREQASPVVNVVDPRWRGYVTNISPSLFETRFRERLPVQITGRSFLENYTGTTDAVTTVDPQRTYAVRNPTAHPVYEHFRVRAFAQLLQLPEQAVADPRQPPATDASSRAACLHLLGELMYQSHASYSACGLGSEGTDLLVQLVRDAGGDRGLFGAKITGGGSGGTVAVLARRGSAEAVQAVADEYARRTGHRPYIFSGSSPGAARFGVLRLVPQR